MRDVLFQSWRAACLAATLIISAPAHAACPPPDESVESLTALKQSGFELDDAARRNALARDLLDCLADPDPTLRDGIGFEAYSVWLRGDLLEVATRVHMLEVLSAAMSSPTPDPAGFHAPFAALVLSEVARSDRIAPWMSQAQRAELVDAAARYVESVRDYRGFDPVQGWRHGVAHGADLLMQLGLNPALERPALDRLLAAIARQVAPVGEHAYVDGESERLARALLFIAQRGLHDDAAWKAWFDALVQPTPLASWSEAYASRAGLAKRHNLLSFLRVAYVGAREGGDPKFEVLVPHLREAMKALP
jgi:hypothetical protein